MSESISVAGAATSRGVEDIAQTPAVADDGAASRWVALLLGLMMILVPAVGMPSEEMLQDTLKSAIVSLMTIGAALVYFAMPHRREHQWVWHTLMWLPIALALYAVGSTVWSHAYLGGVEAIRWGLFSLLLWLGINVKLEDFGDRVIWGIHWGVTIASVWAALQFWSNFSLFPQGPNPASTFINRNFFAEYAVCALPYSVYLMIQARDFRLALGLAVIIGYNIVVLMMTGTRSALLGLSIYIVVAPIFVFLFRQQLPLVRWGGKGMAMLAIVLAGSIMSLGSIDGNNPKLIAEYGRQNAIGHAVGRTASVVRPDEYAVGTFSIRRTMWAATGRMILANPVTGVGAGAWEVFIPVYQVPATQTETDFYAHNELLQLLAEYGIVGWVFIACLLGYLAIAAWTTIANRKTVIGGLSPLRLTALASVLILLVVSNAGFPWRLASTGALFALSLSLLGAIDAATGQRSALFVRTVAWSRVQRLSAIVIASTCMLLALYTTERAAECEKKLIRAIKLAMAISRSGTSANPYWDEAKIEVLALTQQGIAINSHYRKLTPIIADEWARMNEWENALGVYETILESRPYIVAIVANMARGHLELGNFAKAEAYLEHANQLQPTAPGVRSLNALMNFRLGNDAVAGMQIKELFKDHIVDYDIVNAAYAIGSNTRDYPLMVRSLELRMKHWPQESVDCLLKLGALYAEESPIHSESLALRAFQSAMAAAPGHQKIEVSERIPPAYRR